VLYDFDLDEVVGTVYRIAEEAARDRWADHATVVDFTLMTVRYGARLPEEYFLRLDGPLFRQQRELLLSLLRNFNEHLLTGEQADLLAGLATLLDELADQAYDRYGIDCLLEGEKETGEP